MRLVDPLCLLAASLVSLGFIAGTVRLVLAGEDWWAAGFLLLAFLTLPRWR